MNLHRRHDTKQQLGISAGEAVELQEKLDKEAKERIEEGQEKGRQSQKSGCGPRGPQPKRRSRDDLGKAFGVSGRTAERGAQSAATAPQCVPGGRAAIDGRDPQLRNRRNRRAFRGMLK